MNECGEIIVGDGDVTYAPWSHAGRPLLLHFIPARAGADAANSGALRRVVRARPPIRPLTVTLVNQKDAIWGTGGIVKAIVESRKRELPNARMVIDCEGKVGETWSLPEGESVLMLIDAAGQVRFVQVGATPPERVQTLIDEVEALGLAEAP